MFRQATLATILAAALCAPAIAQVPGISSSGTIGAGPGCSGPGCAGQGKPGIRGSNPGPEQRIPPGYYRPSPPDVRPRPPAVRPPAPRPPSGYYRPYPPDDGHHYRERVSCREAERIVRRNGYGSVRTIECSGRYYHFVAKRRGRTYEVTVRSADGRIVAAERI